MTSDDTAVTKPTEFDRALSKIRANGWNEAGTGCISLRIEGIEGLSIDPGGPSRGLPFPAPELDETLILMGGPGSEPKEAGLVRVSGSELTYRLLRGTGPAASALELHLAIHRMTVLERPHVKAVIHVRPPNLVGLSEQPDVRDKGAMNEILRKHLPEVGARRCWDAQLVSEF